MEQVLIRHNTMLQYKTMLLSQDDTQIKEGLQKKSR